MLELWNRREQVDSMATDRTVFCLDQMRTLNNQRGEGTGQKVFEVHTQND